MAKANETTTKFKVDISDLKKGIQEASRQIKLANAEFKAAASGMDDWSKSADGLSKKIGQLETVLDAQKKILDSYQKQLALISDEYGENSKEADEMRIRIANQQAVVNGTAKELEKYHGILKELRGEQEKSAEGTEKQSRAYDDLKESMEGQQKRLDDLKDEYKQVVIEQGKNSDSAKALAKEIDDLSGELASNQKAMENADKAADDLDHTLDDVGDSAKRAGDGGFTVLKGALANLVSKGFELAISAAKKLGEEIVELGKQSIANYAEYEQLTGGVETLFKESSKQVQKYAKDAYKTAGMSANEYMDTVTGFSASLLQGLGGNTEEAAKIANQAIVDMSDNANKMGSDIKSIQNAYQGFAKQNYNMLDNLKLGYGGTQAEMARLINDSGVLGDTIEVTAETVKDVSFDKIIEAIHKVQTEMGITGTTAEEAATTIEGSKNSMQAAWQNLLTGLADENVDLGALFDAFMDSAETYLGNLLPRVRTLVDRVIDFVAEEVKTRFPVVAEAVNALWNILQWIIDNGNEIISILTGIGAALIAWNVATVAANVLKMVKALKAMGAASAIAAAKQWLLNTALLANPIGLVVAAIVGLVTAFVMLWNKSEKFREFWLGLWDGIKSAVKGAWDFIEGIFEGTWDFLQGLWNGAIDFFSNTWEGIKDIFSGVASWVNANVFKPIMKFFEPLIDFFRTGWNIIKELAEGVWTTIKILWGMASGWFNEHVIQPVSEWFEKLWGGIKEKAQEAWDFVAGVWTAVSSWFDEKVVKPVSEWFSGMWEKLKKDASDAWEGIKEAFKPVADWFESTFRKAWQKVKDVFSTGGKIFDGIKEGILDGFKAVVNALIRGINKIIQIPFKAINDSLDKISRVSIAGVKPFENLVSRFDIPQIPELAKGGVLRKGQKGFLEGDGAEAVVPLDQNKRWIAATAKELRQALVSEGLISPFGGSAGSVNNNYNFVQNNTSPKALNRLEIYRQTRNQLEFAKGVS